MKMSNPQYQNQRPDAAAPDGNPHGTTVLGIYTDDGVIIASDRKTSRWFSTHSKDSQKIRKVHPRGLMTRVGSVADSQSVESTLKSEVTMYESRRGRNMSIKALAKVASNYIQSCGHVHTAPLIGGVDEDGPALYSIGGAGSMIPFDNFVVSGSGGNYATGVLEQGYDSDLTLEQAQDLAREAIRAATERDNMSGNGLNLGTATAEEASIVTFDEVPEEL